MILNYRFNAKLSAELPTHPSLFLFMNKLQSTVIRSGMAIVAQCNSGRQRLRKVNDRVRHILLDKAAVLEREYLAGTKTATDVLRAAACHYDDDKVVEVFSAFADSIVVRELNSGELLFVKSTLPNIIKVTFMY